MQLEINLFFIFHFNLNLEVKNTSSYQTGHLKSLGPIDHKFHRHCKNDGFVLYEYMIKQCSIQTSELWKKYQRKYHVNSKQKVRHVYG